ncbi:MAG: primosomal protein N' [Bacteroidia bacterium]
MEERATLFVDVILPLAVPNLYTYRVPYDWNELVKPGQRVVVQFGKNKLYMALIKRLHQAPPAAYQAKYVLDILDAKPIVNEMQLGFWDWIASYYLCSPGEVMNAALPAGLRFSSETRIVRNKDFALDEVNEGFFTAKEWKLVIALDAKQEMSVDEASKAAEIKNVQPVIQALLTKGFVLLKEDIKESYKPRMETFVRISPALSEAELHKIMDALEKKAFKQLQLLMAYMQLSQWHTGNPAEVKKSKLLLQSGCSAGVLYQMVKKGIMEACEREVSRLPLSDKAIEQANALADFQQAAYNEITEQFKSKDVVLLHGVTSSGKTEIYMRLIEEVMAQKKQVLYLLPEIALTAQLVQRLKKRWGNKVGVYHSKYSDNERVEAWNTLVNPKDREYDVIIGTRSSLFLPFSKLGLLIVDEEHDSSYKQQDPAPRYHARDSAIYLAGIHKAKVVLGSATPCIESYYNAINNKYGLVELNTRYGGMEMPEIDVRNVGEEKRKKLMKSLFSPFLLTNIEEALGKKEQVILFQNRRGFAPFIECDVCGHVPQCINCDVSLTYHKQADLLRCHYCGYSAALPKSCPACGSPGLHVKGFGTERVEEELSIFFPQARIARMDLDSTRAKQSHSKIISQFEDREIDILVGTQMVTKGLDFDNVSIVGVLNADAGMHFPDFRAPEKSYQLMAQVSGRAGRKNKRGKVIIQTNDPEHPIIQQVVKNDYIGMYKEQIEERKKFHYPPFTRLIEITLSQKRQDDLDAVSPDLAIELKKRFGAERVLGPEYPVVAKVNNYFLKTILLKVEKEKYSQKVKALIMESLNEFFHKGKEYARTRVKIDVDPQ